MRSLIIEYVCLQDVTASLEPASKKKSDDSRFLKAAARPFKFAKLREMLKDRFVVAGAWGLRGTK